MRAEPELRHTQTRMPTRGSLFPNVCSASGSAQNPLASVLAFYQGRTPSRGHGLKTCTQQNRDDKTRKYFTDILRARVHAPSCTRHVNHFKTSPKTEGRTEVPPRVYQEKKPGHVAPPSRRKSFSNNDLAFFKKIRHFFGKYEGITSHYLENINNN